MKLLVRLENRVWFVLNEDLREVIQTIIADNNF